MTNFNFLPDLFPFFHPSFPPRAPLSLLNREKVKKACLLGGDYTSGWKWGREKGNRTDKKKSSFKEIGSRQNTKKNRDDPGGMKHVKQLLKNARNA